MKTILSLERDLTKVLLGMERRGILIDPAYTLAALKYEQEQMVKVNFEFREKTGHDFKDSPKFLKDIFIEHGMKYPTTAKGNPSFNSDALEDMKNPITDCIKRYRDHEKRAGTYYSSFLYYGDSDNRIHASANQSGTTSGRMSYSNPNLQNVPKQDEEKVSQESYVVRGCFVPTPGNIFVSIDYDQQEFRMMLDYAGEKKIIKEILDGADVHQATADLLGISRKAAKTINFALLYGVGIAKLSTMLNLPSEQTKQLRQEYFVKLPGVERFLHKVRRKGERQGYVTNWLGRRCYIDKFEDAYKLPNHLIQGGCADVVKLAMVKINDRFGPNHGMIIQVHDELLFDMPPDHFSRISEIMEIMENVYPSFNGMRLTTSVSFSPKSWAHADQIQGIPEAFKFHRGDYGKARIPV